MSGTDPLDRRVAAFVRDGVEHGPADGLARAMARTADIGQRPALFVAAGGSTRGLDGGRDRRPMLAAGLVVATALVALAALALAGGGRRADVSDVVSPLPSAAVQDRSIAPSPGPTAPTAVSTTSESVRYPFAALGFSQAWFTAPYQPEVLADVSTVAFRSPTFTTGRLTGSYTAWVSMGRPDAGAVVEWQGARGQVCGATPEEAIRSLMSVLPTVGEPNHVLGDGFQYPTVALAPTNDAEGAATVIVENGRCAAIVVSSKRDPAGCGGQVCTIHAMEAIRWFVAGFAMSEPEQRFDSPELGISTSYADDSVPKIESDAAGHSLAWILNASYAVAVSVGSLTDGVAVPTPRVAPKYPGESAPSPVPWTIIAGPTVQTLVTGDLATRYGTVDGLPVVRAGDTLYIVDGDRVYAIVWPTDQDLTPFLERLRILDRRFESQPLGFSSAYMQKQDLLQTDPARHVVVFPFGGQPDFAAAAASVSVGTVDQPAEITTDSSGGTAHVWGANLADLVSRYIEKTGQSGVPAVAATLGTEPAIRIGSTVLAVHGDRDYVVRLVGGFEAPSDAVSAAYERFLGSFAFVD